MDLKIQLIKTKKDDIKQPPLAEANVIPRINSSTIVIGASSSGKSNVVANLLTRKDMLGGVFDRKFLISPTAKTDDIQKYLKIPDEDILDNLADAPAILAEVMKDQREEIEEVGPVKAKKILFYYDDVVSDADLLKSTEFIDSFILNRHYNATTIICSQSYKAIPRKCRFQAKNIIFFKSSISESECIAEDRAPPFFDKHQTLDMIEFATKEPYSFLHIVMAEPYETRYRRNLDEVIHISDAPPSRKRRQGGKRKNSEESEIKSQATQNESDTISGETRGS